MNAILLCTFFGMFFMLLGVFARVEKKDLSSIFIGILGLALTVNIIENNTIGVTFMLFSPEALQNWILIDASSLNLQLLVLLSLLVYVLLQGESMLDSNYSTELLALILFSVVGIFLMFSFTHLLILFLAIEIFSMPQYILVGSYKSSFNSVEASLKYFLMGAFFSAILLFGIAFIYGAVGSFEVKPIVYSFLDSSNVFFLLGVSLVLVALLFKCGIAPFHFWSPDVYQGTPSSLIGFVAGITKIGTFFLLFRFFDLYELNLFEHGSLWSVFISVAILLSLFIANFLAVYQSNYKRMLAYSGIAQGAFMLFALYDTNHWSHQGLLIFTFGYALALIGAFSVLSAIDEQPHKGQLQGFAERHPISAAMLTVSLLSLAGIPGTAGFLGKFYMLTIGVNYASIWVVIVSVLFSAISLYYYLPLIKEMYFYPSKGASYLQIYPSMRTRVVYVIVILLIISIGWGILPSFYFFC